MFNVNVQVAKMLGVKHYCLEKEMELPFVPLVGMGLDFEYAPLDVTSVKYVVGQGSFVVEAAWPEEIWTYKDGVREKVTPMEFVEMLRDGDGFTLEVLDLGAKKAKQKRAKKKA